MWLVGARSTARPEGPAMGWLHSTSPLKTMEQVLKDFGINPLLLAAQVVNFLILLFILKKFLYKPILSVLDERKKRIEESLKNAQEIEKRLLQTEEDRQKILAKATAQTQKMMDETKKEIILMKEESRQQTQQQVETMMKKAQELVRLEKEKMMIEAKGELSDLVLSVLRKVTGQVLTKDVQKKMIEEEIKNLS